MEAGLHERTVTYKEIAEKVAPQVTGYTVRRRLTEKHLYKWIAKESEYLDEEIAGKRWE